jgi:hypothetical protein
VIPYQRAANRCIQASSFHNESKVHFFSSFLDAAARMDLVGIIVGRHNALIDFADEYEVGVREQGRQHKAEIAA